MVLKLPYVSESTISPPLFHTESLRWDVPTQAPHSLQYDPHGLFRRAPMLVQQPLECRRHNLCVVVLEIRQLACAVRAHLIDQVIAHLEYFKYLCWRSAQGIVLAVFLHQIHLWLRTGQARRRSLDGKVVWNTRVVRAIDGHGTRLLQMHPA